MRTKPLKLDCGAVVTPTYSHRMLTLRIDDPDGTTLTRSGQGDGPHAVDIHLFPEGLPKVAKFIQNIIEDLVQEMAE